MDSTFSSRSLILCVSTDPSWVEQLREATQALSDVEWVSVHSPSEALEFYKQPAHAPRICIVDSVLGDTEGKSLIEQIQRKVPRLASALVCGFDEMKAGLDAIKAHIADRIILRRVTPSDLVGHIQSLLAHQQRLEDLAEHLKDSEGKHLFVTGSSGFLGGQFVRDALRCSDIKITALSRERKGVPYDERLDFDTRGFADRLHFVEGDVVNETVGLSEELRASLAETIDEVWHFAAITSFDEVLREKTMSVNIKGTEHVLRFAQTIPRLKAFNHISTAYVCGDTVHPAVIKEMTNSEEPTFRNPYDESKFHAENRVIDSGLPYRIFRPSIVLGEQVSGRNDGQTVYNIAKMAFMAKRLSERDCEAKGLPLDSHSFRVVLDPAATKNLIPVDTVNHAMLRVSSLASVQNNVFHITNPFSTPISNLVHIITELLEFNQYSVVDSLQGEDLSVPEKVFDRVASVFRPYMTTSDPIFDTQNLECALKHYAAPALSKEELRESMDAFYAQYFGDEYRSNCLTA